MQPVQVDGDPAHEAQEELQAVQVVRVWKVADGHATKQVELYSSGWLAAQLVQLVDVPAQLAQGDKQGLQAVGDDWKVPLGHAEKQVEPERSWPETHEVQDDAVPLQLAQGVAQVEQAVENAANDPLGHVE